MPITPVRTVDVDFPHTPYDCQLVYMERVIETLQTGADALLESPTGTGKTLCLLCAAVAWQAAVAAGKEPRPPARRSKGGGRPLATEGAQTFLPAGSEGTQKAPTIVYASRTHSQLTQVINELKKTVYAPRTVVLGSRQQLCIHPRVSQLRGMAQNGHCRTLVKNDSCRFYHNVKKFKKPSSAGIQDIEELARMGANHHVCPYYYSRSEEALNDAQVIFMPYNYLISPETRQTLNINWQNVVIVFDEAHNLDSVCAEAASIDISAVALAACMSELDQAIDLLGSDHADLNSEEVSQSVRRRPVSKRHSR